MGCIFYSCTLITSPKSIGKIYKNNLTKYIRLQICSQYCKQCVIYKILYRS